MKSFNLKRFLAVVLGIVMFFLCFFTESKSYSTISAEEAATEGETDPEKLEIKFFPLKTVAGSYVPGDSCIITIGDVQILIDSGCADSHGGANANKSIKEQLDKVLDKKDKVWEYVIVTHGDADHCGGFSTKENEYNDEAFKNDKDGIFKHILENENKGSRKIGTLIDFDTKQNNPFVKNFSGGDLAYSRYVISRDYLISKKYIENYYTSEDCCKEGKPKEFSLTENCKLNILYNCFTGKINVIEKDENGNPLKNKKYKYVDGKEEMFMSEAAAKNVIAVCCLITWEKDEKKKNFLFTGDLGEYDSGRNYKQIFGETKLFENNKELLKDGVDFFKAAHHGSKTSNSKEFIDKLKPAYVVVPACAGGMYGFPSGVAMDNFIKHTKKIYIPSKRYFEKDLDRTPNDEKDKKEPKTSEYYGVITIACVGDKISVECTGETQSIEKTEWYREFAALRVYVFSGYDGDKDSSYVGRCTLIRYKGVNILIDCGVYGTIGKNAINTRFFLKKVQRLCGDEMAVLDYVIVTSPYTYSIQQMVDATAGDKVEKGVLSAFTVKNLIDFGVAQDPSSGARKSLFKEYENARAKFQEKNKDDESCKYWTAADCVNRPFEINDEKNVKLNILRNEYYGNKSAGRDAAISCSIDFYGKKLLFLGNMSENGEQSVADANDFSNVIFYNAVGFGDEDSNNNAILNKIQSPRNARLYIAINTIAGKDVFGYTCLSAEMCKRLYAKSRYTYFTAHLEEGKYVYDCGNIIFSVVNTGGSLVSSSLMGTYNTVPLEKSAYCKDMGLGEDEDNSN